MCVAILRIITLMVVYYLIKISWNRTFLLIQNTLEICVHHGWRVVTTNALYEYCGEEEYMIFN